MHHSLIYRGPALMLGRALGWLPAGSIAAPQPRPWGVTRTMSFEQKGWRTTTANSHASDVEHNLARLEPGIEAVVRSIHATATKATILVTGGASQAIAWLASVPGASNTVIEASALYSRESSTRALVKTPSQFSSPEMAIELAVAAYKKSADLTPFGTPIVGIGAACALASEPPKRGQHRAYVAAHTGAATYLYSLQLAKGCRSRWQEEELVGRLLVKALAAASSADVQGPSLDLITKSDQHDHQQQQQQVKQQQRPQQEEEDDDKIDRQQPDQYPTPSQQQQQQQQTSSISSKLPDSTPAAKQPPPPPPAAVAASSTAEAAALADGPVDIYQEQLLPSHPDPIQDLLDGKVRSVEYSGGMVVVDAPRRGRVYLPGSFNPLHEGHKRLLEAAVAAVGADGGEGCFELSVGNADKGLLPYHDIEARVAQFTAAGLPLVLTSAPLFTGKVLLFPGSNFVVGYDTAVRMVMPKYYGDSVAGMLVEFERARCHGCSFLVAGRYESSSGGFKQLSDMEVPRELADLFAAIPEEQFRVDLSSTELRGKGKGLAVLA